MSDLQPRPTGEELLRAARAGTPARGFRGGVDGGYTTASLLALRADHAAARDAVHADLDVADPAIAEVMRAHDVLLVSSAATDRREHLLRPDLGRRLSDNARASVREGCPAGADLQVLIGDGLSATAVHAQVPTATLRGMIYAYPTFHRAVEAALADLGTD